MVGRDTLQGRGECRFDTRCPYVPCQVKCPSSSSWLQLDRDASRRQGGCPTYAKVLAGLIITLLAVAAVAVPLGIILGGAAKKNKQSSSKASLGER